MLTYASTRVPRNSRWDPSRPRTTVCTPASLTSTSIAVTSPVRSTVGPPGAVDCRLSSTFAPISTCAFARTVPASSENRSTNRSGTLVLSST